VNIVNGEYRRRPGLGECCERRVPETAEIDHVNICRLRNVTEKPSFIECCEQTVPETADYDRLRYVHPEMCKFLKYVAQTIGTDVSQMAHIHDYPLKVICKCESLIQNVL
jgi:hypothetical protein